MAKSVKAIILRVLAQLSFLVAAIVMLFSFQKVEEETFTFIVRYKDWNGFIFCGNVNWIGFSYNLAVLLVPAGSPLWKTVVVLDVIVNIAVGMGLGAGWQTYLLIRQGNIYGRWSPSPSMCGIAPHFCDKILGSLITSTFGFGLDIARPNINSPISLSEMDN